MHAARLLRPLVAAAGITALAMLAVAPAGAAAVASPKAGKIVQVRPMIRLPGHSTTGRTAFSANWAGYVTLARHPSGSFRFVQATFTVPSVNCTTTPGSFSVHWVGLDGFTPASATVEQAGVESACDGATPAYSAWWEIFPGNSIQTVFSLNAGDAVTASVFFNAAAGAHHDQYNLVLTDVTSGQNFNLWESCATGSNCMNDSAEVISEAPSSGGTIQPLADYGIMNFVNVKVTDKSGQKGGITSSNWLDDKVVQVNSLVQTLATPGSLFGGQAFSNTWKQES